MKPDMQSRGWIPWGIWNPRHFLFFGFDVSTNHHVEYIPTSIAVLVKRRAGRVTEMD